MINVLPLTASDRIRVNLYNDYCKELDLYDEHPVPGDGTRQALRYLRGQAGTRWIDIRCEKKIVGFLILFSASFAGVMYSPHFIHICEAFVAPEYRNRGLMSKAVEQALNGFEMDVTLEVFKKNPARDFWVSMLEKNGYEKIQCVTTVRNDSLLSYRFRCKKSGLSEE